MATLTKVTLLSFSLIGAVMLHGISTKSGFYDQIEDYKRKLVLSDGSSYNPKITGIAALDDGFLGIIVQFFYPCVDGQNPGLSLLSFLFAGQGTAFLAMTFLDAFRSGNKGKLIS